MQSKVDLDSNMMEKIIREEAREVIESICWKVLPEIAERVVRAELNKLLKEAGIDRRKVYVTNVVKYRPIADKQPTPKEIKSHASFLKEEIRTVNPEIVVTLGNLALNGVGLRIPVENVHGRTFPLGGYRLLPTFHPERALRDPDAKILLEADFAKLKELFKSPKPKAN